MPYKHKILLITGVMIVMLLGLVGFTLYYVIEIQRENDEVRLWGRVTDRMHVAIETAKRLQGLAGGLETAVSDKREGLLFDYSDLYLRFNAHALHPEDLEKMTAENRAFVTALSTAIAYHEPFDPRRVQRTIERALPGLQAIHDNFWSNKRAAYTYHFEKLKFTTASTVISVCLAILLLCIGIGLTLSNWVIRSLQLRLTELASWAKRVRAGDLTPFPPPAVIRDELDTLADCLSQMTERLITVVSTQKALEGAEDERRRIAMDLHDEVLGELTYLSRELDRLCARMQDANEYRARLSSLDTGLRDTAMRIRRIIDDLHPQSLDILGVEAAVFSFLKSKTAEPGSPHHSLRFDPRVEDVLTETQRLNLYRVACEAITNVLQHAHCSSFDVEFQLTPDGIRVTIDDDGVGFSVRETARTAGHGLNNIRQRAQSMGARAAWRPRAGQTGTHFEFLVPCAPIPQKATA